MNTARKLHRGSTHLGSGVVVEAAERLRVQIEDESFEAVRAKSCLVAPELGDRVLCAIETDAVFILAVLAGAETTRLTSDAELAIEAPHLILRAQEGTVAIGRLGFFGSLVEAQVRKLGVLAEEVDSVAARITQRAKRVFRFVEELDQLRAGNVDMRAESLASIRGENALISARVLAKIDGEQINLG